MCWVLGVTWWRHQMETYSALLALCAGNSSVTGDSPHKGQWRRALMFSLICGWKNGWVNNRNAGNLRRHRDHCDVIVMGKTVHYHKLYVFAFSWRDPSWMNETMIFYNAFLRRGRYLGCVIIGSIWIRSIIHFSIFYISVLIIVIYTLCCK